MFGRCATVVRHVLVPAVAVALFVERSALAQANGGFPIEEPAQPRAVAPAPPTPRPVPAPPRVTPPRVTPAPVAPAPRVAPRSTVPASPRPVSPPPAAVPAPSTITPPAYAPAAQPELPANLSLPLVLPYRQGMPVPRGYHIESRASSGLVWTGALALGAGYIAALGIGANDGFDGSKGWLALPVVGAWPAIAGQKISCTAATVEEARQCLDRASSLATTMALIAVDGMIQTTGLLLFIAGLATRQSELVRDDIALHLSAKHRPEGGFDVGVAGRF